MKEEFTTTENADINHMSRRTISSWNKDGYLESSVSSATKRWERAKYSKADVCRTHSMNFFRELGYSKIDAATQSHISFESVGHEKDQKKFILEYVQVDKETGNIYRGQDIFSYFPEKERHELEQTGKYRSVPIISLLDILEFVDYRIEKLGIK
jgi:hypothetical protein